MDWLAYLFVGSWSLAAIAGAAVTVSYREGLRTFVAVTVGAFIAMQVLVLLACLAVTLWNEPTRFEIWLYLACILVPLIGVTRAVWMDYR